MLFGNLVFEFFLNFFLWQLSPSIYKIITISQIINTIKFWMQLCMCNSWVQLTRDRLQNLESTKNLWKLKILNFKSNFKFEWNHFARELMLYKKLKNRLRKFITKSQFIILISQINQFCYPFNQNQVQFSFLLNSLDPKSK